MKEVKPKLEVTAVGITSVAYNLASYFWVSLGLPIVLIFAVVIFHDSPWQSTHHDKNISPWLYLLFVVLAGFTVLSLYRGYMASQSRSEFRNRGGGSFDR
jgi:hypothetical protein